MAQRELAWQSKIVKTVRASGAYAEKTAHRTKVGVPDLLIKLPDLPAALIEIKHIELTPDKKIVNIELTRPQALHLKSFTKAGGRAFWMAVCTFTYRQDVVHLLASDNTEDLKWSINRVMAEGQTLARGTWGTHFLPALTRYITRLTG